VLHIYIYIYIYDISSLRVNEMATSSSIPNNFLSRYQIYPTTLMNRYGETWDRNTIPLTAKKTEPNFVASEISISLIYDTSYIYFLLITVISNLTTILTYYSLTPVSHFWFEYVTDIGIFFLRMNPRGPKHVVDIKN